MDRNDPRRKLLLKMEERRLARSVSDSSVCVLQGDHHILGRGKFGCVRAATLYGTTVAAKQLHEVASPRNFALITQRSAAAQRRRAEGNDSTLSREAEVALLSDLAGTVSFLRHPNLVLFLGVVYDPSTWSLLSIIFERLETSVHDLVEGRGAQLEPAEVFGIGADIAAALTFLHSTPSSRSRLEFTANLTNSGHCQPLHEEEKGGKLRQRPIVHGDISARNVLLDPHGRAKLANLGLAKALGAQGHYFDPSVFLASTALVEAAEVTAGGKKGAVGSSVVRPYAAPEVATNGIVEALEPAADVFSLGVLLMQLCSSERPDPAIRELQLQRSQATVPAARELLSSCVSFHPQQRPRAPAVLEELQRLQRHCSEDPRLLYPFDPVSATANAPKIGTPQTTLVRASPHMKEVPADGAEEPISPLFDAGSSAASAMQQQRLRQVSVQPVNVGLLGRLAVLDAITRETGALRKQMATLEARLLSEKDRWRLQANARDAAEERVDHLYREGVERSGDDREIESNLARRDEDVSAADAEMRAARAQAAGIEDHVAEMSKELGSIRDELSDARREGAKLQEELEKTQQNLAGTKGMMEVADKRTVKAVERVKKAEAARDEAQGVRKRLTEALEAVKEYNEELNARLDQAISRWEKEKVVRLQYKKDVAALSEAATEAQASMRESHAARASAETKARELCDAHVTSQRLAADKAALEADLVAARSRLAATEGDLAAQTSKLQGEIAAKEAVEAVRAEAAAALDVTRVEASAASARADKLGESLAGEQIKTQRLEADLAEAQAELALAKGLMLERQRLHNEEIGRLEDAVASVASKATGGSDDDEAAAAAGSLDRGGGKVVNDAAPAELGSVGAGGGRAVSGGEDGPIGVTTGSSKELPVINNSSSCSTSVRSDGVGRGVREVPDPSLSTSRFEAQPSSHGNSPTSATKDVSKPVSSRALVEQGMGGVVGVLCSGTYADDVAALSAAVRALKDLTKGGGGGGGDEAGTFQASDLARLEAGEGGACEGLVDVLSRHAAGTLQGDGDSGDGSGNVAFAKRVLQAMANLAFGSDANRRRFGACGAAAAVVRTMNRHKKSADVAAAAFAVLTNLAHNSPENRAALLIARAVEATLGAMKQFPLDVKVQRQACWALLTLAASDAIALRVQELGGVEAVVAAMTNCSENDTVQHFGCWALANVAWIGSGEDLPDGTEGAAPVGSLAWRNQRAAIAMAPARAQGAAEMCRIAARKFPWHGGIAEKSALALDKLSLITGKGDDSSVVYPSSLPSPAKSRRGKGSVGAAMLSRKGH